MADFQAVPAPGYIIQDFVQSAMTHKSEHDGTLNPAEHWSFLDIWLFQWQYSKVHNLLDKDEDICVILSLYITTVYFKYNNKNVVAVQTLNFNWKGFYKKMFRN